MIRKLWKLDSDTSETEELCEDQKVKMKSHFQGISGSVFLFLISILTSHFAFANSEKEQGGHPAASGPESQPSTVNAENFLTNSGQMINEFSGNPAFDIDIGSISSGNGLNFPLKLKYYGGVGQQDKTVEKYSSTPFVGQGFTFPWPRILADNKGTTDLSDDTYYLSLDGQPVKMVPLDSNANSFILKNDPTIRITRTVDTVLNQSATEPWPFNSNLHPPGTFNFSVPRITSWKVNFPDGITYRFDLLGTCDSDSGVMCAPVINGKIDYQPFYTYSIGAHQADQWNISSIRDRDNKFGFFFHYTKATDTITGIDYDHNFTVNPPKVTAERAIYLKDIISTNGTGEDAETTGQALFTLMDKPITDYFDFTAQSPLLRYERKCLQKVTLISHGKIARKYNLSYGSTANNKLRLEKITETDPIFGKERDYFKFDYDSLTRWKLARVTNPSGVTNSFSWQTSGSLSIGNDIDISSYVGNITTAKINIRMEYGNDYFLSVEAPAGCGTANTNKLFQFTNNGGYWQLKRIFKAPVGDCLGKFYIAPDASYFLYLSAGYQQTGGGNTPRLWVYNLPLKDGPNRLPLVIDLAANPSPIPATNFTAIDTADKVFTFNNWFALYDNLHNTGTGQDVSHDHNEVRFYQKGKTGVWLDGTKNLDGTNAPSGCVVPIANDSATFLTSYPRSGCVIFQDRLSSQIVVRQGKDFLAVVSNTIGPNAVLHVFGYNNGIHQYVKGLMKSGHEKGVGIPFSQLQGYSGDEKDFWNNFDGFVIDLSVSVAGNFIIIENKVSNQLTQGFMVLAWDGYQLRYVGEEHVEPQDFDHLANSDQFYTGPDYFVRKAYVTGSSPPAFNFYYYKVDLKSWKLIKSQPLLPSPVPDGVVNHVHVVDNWTVNTMSDYFSIDDMRDPSKTYEPAVVLGDGTLADYPHKNKSVLFYIHGTNGELTTQVNVLPGTTYTLGNVFKTGDKMLGLAIPGTGQGNYGFYFGKLAGTFDSPVWTFNSVSKPADYPTYSASLLSSGAVLTSFNGGFTGKIRFLGENKGALEQTKSTTGDIVSSVSVGTRGANSSVLDGTLKTVNLVYDPDGTSIFNGITKTPNFNKAEKDEINGNKIVGKLVTSYSVDQLKSDNTPTLSDDQKDLHGLPILSQFQSYYDYSVSAPTGWTQNTVYNSTRFNTTVESDSLREPAYLVSAPSSIKREMYIPASHDTAYVEKKVRAASLDRKNGRYKVKIIQNGPDYLVEYTTFEHEFTANVPAHLIRQTATFLFSGSDPCTNSQNAIDPCGNIDSTWLLDPLRQIKAISSQIITYANDAMPQGTWEWHPQTLGVTPLQTLSGNLNSGNWINVESILERNRDGSSARTKDMSPTLILSNGAAFLNDKIPTTFFYGGSEPNQIGKVVNSLKSNCTLLNGEEESVTPGRFGAFGEWEPAGSILSQEIIHAGNNSFKCTQIYGPSVEIHYHGENNPLWSKKKGFVISGWIFAKGQRSTTGNDPNDPNPAFVVELRDSAHQVKKNIDLVGEYGTLPYNRWVKLERMVTYDELKTNTPDSGSYLRVWAGKSSSLNANPVYVDDLRIYPSDATVTTWNYNELQQVTSSFDANNEPLYFQYDVWGTPLGTKDKRGIGYSATAVKKFSE